MAMYEANPPSRGGGLGLLKVAQSLWEQFRAGGVRDQEKQRMALGEQALAANQQQLAFGKTAEARAADLFGQTTAANTQAFDSNAKKSAQNAASRAVGNLPDMSAFEIDPAASDFGGWQGATGPELKQGLEQTPWAELNDAQKGVVGKLPGQHAQLSPLDLGPTWDMNVGVQTGGQKGIATTGTQRAGGETQMTGEPVSELNRKSQTASGKIQNDRAESLLKDFRGEKTVQNYYGAKAAIDTIRRSVASSAKNPSGPADITLLTSFMRSIDPGSTVREGEFATAKNAGGIPEKFVSLYNSLVGKGMLSQAQRQQILAASEENFQSHVATMGAIRNQYAEHAAKLGVSPHYFAEAGADQASQPDAPGAPSSASTTFNSVKELEGRDPSEVVGVIGENGDLVTGTVAEHLAAAKTAPPPPEVAPATERKPLLRQAAEASVDSVLSRAPGTSLVPSIVGAGQKFAEDPKESLRSFYELIAPHLLTPSEQKSEVGLPQSLSRTHAALPKPSPLPDIPADQELGVPQGRNFSVEPGQVSPAQMASFLSWRRLNPNASPASVAAWMKQFLQPSR